MTHYKFCTEMVNWMEEETFLEVVIFSDEMTVHISVEITAKFETAKNLVNLWKHVYDY